MRKVFVIYVSLRDDDTYYARVEGLKGCIAYGATLAQLFERIQEAIRVCLSVEAED